MDNIDNKALTVWVGDSEGNLIQRPASEIMAPNPRRQLPRNREERRMAYGAALRDLQELLSRGGFHTMCEVDQSEEHPSLSVSRGRFSMLLKVMENTGTNVAYVTSNVNYDPSKAGTPESKATIRTGRDLFASKEILQVTVTGQCSVTTFVELPQQGLPDPQLHIVKSVFFIMHEASRQDSALAQAMRHIARIPGCPSEWLPPETTEAERMLGINSNPVSGRLGY